MRRSTRFLRREDGGVIVEFALVMPILLLLVFGIIDFGRALFMVNNLTSAAREGARYAAVQASLADPEPVKAVVRRYITDFGGTGSPTITVTPRPPDAAGRIDIEVQISNYAFRPITPLAGMVGFGTINLGSKAVFRWELSG